LAPAIVPHRPAVIAALVLASAALYVLSFPGWNVSFLGWVALVPFLSALRGLRPGRGFLAGLLWGTATIWGIGYWLPVALSTYWGQPAWFGLLCAFFGSVVFVGLYSAGFAACVCCVARRWGGARRAAAVAVLWVAWEVARGRLLTGDPWLLIGYAPTPTPVWIQIADLGGVYLVSLVVAFTNAALAEMRAAASRAALLELALPLALVLLAAYAYGSIRLSPDSEEATIPVAIVQGNNDLGSQWNPEHYGSGLDNYINMSRRGLPDGLLVWPESAVTFFLADEPAYQRRIGEMLADTGSELIVGAPHRDSADPAVPRYFNSAFHMDSSGNLRGRYDKVHLLPFGEYFPLRTIGLLRRQFERVRTFEPGGEPRPLDTAFGRAAVVICFEAIFPELVRQRMAAGAAFLVNLSNDAWLGSGAGPEQHLAMIPMRAVENRAWVVRATTTGVSAVIDPTGRIQARSKSGEQALVFGMIAAAAGGTIYQRVGDLFAYACVTVSALLILISVGYREPSRGRG
jgi:apolipoprotein N-acyltransferase